MVFLILRLSSCVTIRLFPFVEYPHAYTYIFEGEQEPFKASLFIYPMHIHIHILKTKEKA